MRRALKISAWVVGASSLLVLLLGGALFIAGNTDSGRTMIEKLTRDLTSGHVSLSGLSGSFPQHLMVEHFQLSDDRGVWLRAERVTLDWFAPALLPRREHVWTRAGVHGDLVGIASSRAKA